MKHFCWLWLFLTMACVSELDFDPAGEQYTAISGVITNSIGERTIFISEHKDFDLRGEKLVASGSIFKNGTEETELVAIRPGELVVPLSFRVEAGARYHVEIKAEDGRAYRTMPVEVMPKLQTDSLSFELEERLDGFSSVGAPINIWYVDVYAHVTLPQRHEGMPYYKWQLDESWSFVSAERTCYLHVPASENPVSVLGTEGLQPGSAKIRIGSKALGKEFLDVHYLNAYLHSIDADTYKFYAQAQQLSGEVGSVYDQVPAPIKGNVLSTGDQADVVVGNIEFSLVDTMRLRIERQDIDLRLYSPCSGAFPCAPGTPCVCVDCSRIYGFSSQIKPWYWD